MDESNPHPDGMCLVCGASSFTPLWEILQRCGGCGFVTARLDAPIDARRLYEGDYFTGEEYLDYRADEAFFRKNFRKRLNQIRQHASGGRLLEIGAAYGFFLDLAREYFEVVGYEVNPAAVAYARTALRLEVRQDDFLAATTADIGGPIDVAVLWDVVEHLERPDLFLRKIADSSRPGGVLCLTTGDIGSFVARQRGRKWRMIHPPSHLHYFDRRTITHLLDRCGFEVLEIKAIGVARSIRQILYSILVLNLHAQRLYDTASRIVPSSAGFTLNTYDIMQVVAKRK
jgi:SAM-dependent methyltransferase